MIGGKMGLPWEIVEAEIMLSYSIHNSLLLDILILFGGRLASIDVKTFFF